MRRILLALTLALSAGCSNAPIAGMLDCVSPARGGDAGREPVVPRIKPPGTESLPPGAGAPPPGGGVLPPIAPN